MAVYEVLEVKLKFQDKFMIYLTIINAPLVKKKIKYVFLENHTFTRFNQKMAQFTVGRTSLFLECVYWVYLFYQYY